MKKISTILLLTFYLLLSTGVTVKTHYCGAKLSSVSVLFDVAKCACGKKAMKKNCCKDKSTFIKIKDKQNCSKEINLPSFKKFITLHFAINNTLFISELPCIKVNTLLHKPPLKKRQTLYLYNKVFRI